MDKKSIADNIGKYKFLGEGKDGKAYLMSDGKVVKIFKRDFKCQKEYEILKSVEGSLHFPRAYEVDDCYLIREYVGGVNGYKYLYKYGVTNEFVVNIAMLIDEMKRYGFTKLSVKLQHLYIQKDGRCMLIDPRASYKEVVPYPKTLLKSLKKRGKLKKFMKILKKKRPDYYKEWKKLLKER